MGDPEDRFNRLYLDHHRSVYGYLRRRTDADSARECTADTFVVAWRRRDDIPDGESARSWLYGVAWRQLANRHRKVRSHSTVRERLARIRGPDPETPESVVIRREAGAEVRRALGRLRPDDQEVLRLATWEDLPHADIAQILGCSRHAVDQRIHRATRRLGRQLARTAEPEEQQERKRREARQPTAPVKTGGQS